MVDERVLFLRELFWLDVGGVMFRGFLKEVFILGNGVDLVVIKVVNYFWRVFLIVGVVKIVVVCLEGLESFSDGFLKDIVVICLMELVEFVFVKSEISNEIFLGL